MSLSGYTNGQPETTKEAIHTDPPHLAFSIRDLSLPSVLTLWPVAESLATCLPVGDLITLARTSAELRTCLHGGTPRQRSTLVEQDSRKQDDLNPPPGQHQTSYWAHLKSLAPFDCSSKTHTIGYYLKSCVHCSRPICDACIARDFFNRKTGNSLHKRVRYYCKDCWAEGTPSKGFRYPMSQSTTADIWKPNDEKDVFCHCYSSHNGTLCIDCMRRQEKGISTNGGPSIPVCAKNDYHKMVQCYGLNCRNEIDLNLPDKDRRRICTWCQKPLKRQFGGEERYIWNQKTVEARALNAESRSRDIEEYNRKRLQSLKMSRREMRGESGVPQDEKLDLVRHLDTINYRAFLPEKECPSPDDVYNSKRGIWRYERGFLKAVGRNIEKGSNRQFSDMKLSALQQETRLDGLKFARTNLALHRELSDLLFSQNPPDSNEDPAEIRKWVQLQTQILNMYLQIDPEMPFGQISELIQDLYDVVISPIDLQRRIKASAEHIIRNCIDDTGVRKILAHRCSLPFLPGHEDGEDNNAADPIIDPSNFKSLILDEDGIPTWNPAVKPSTEHDNVKDHRNSQEPMSLNTDAHQHQQLPLRTHIPIQPLHHQWDQSTNILSQNIPYLPPPPREERPSYTVTDTDDGSSDDPPPYAP